MLSVTLSRLHSVTLSRLHSVTLSRLPSTTLSRLPSVTLSRLLSVTLSSVIGVILSMLLSVTLPASISITAKGEGQIFGMPFVASVFLTLSALVALILLLAFTYSSSSPEIMSSTIPFIVTATSLLAISVLPNSIKGVSLPCALLPVSTVISIHPSPSLHTSLFTPKIFKEHSVCTVEDPGYVDSESEYKCTFFPAYSS